MIRPINVLTAMPTRGGVEVASRERGDRYEKCVNLEHDGYCKDLTRPVIRRHDALQKVHDYDRREIAALLWLPVTVSLQKFVENLVWQFVAFSGRMSPHIGYTRRHEAHKIHPTLGISKS